MAPIVSVQIFRGIAAWLVVFHHYIQMYGRDHSEGLPWFIGSKGGFGVDLFFVISGLIMYVTLSRKSYNAYAFFVHRAIRIVPAYWFYTIVLMILSFYFVDEFSATKWNIKSIIMSLFFFPHENPSGLGVFPFLTVGWTLNFEMFFYFCLSLGICFFGKYKFIACSFFIVLFPFLETNQFPVIWRYSSILNDKIIYEFVAGVFIGYLYLKKLIFIQRASLPIGVVCMLLSVVFLFLADTRKVLSFPIWLVPAAGMILSGLFFENYLRTMKLKFLLLLGDISYSTYLIHMLVIGILKRYFIPATLVEESFLLMLLAFIIFILSLISFHTIEKIPARILISFKPLSKIRNYSDPFN